MSLLSWLNHYECESILHHLCMDLEVYLQYVSWQEMIALGVAAEKLAISQLVPINKYVLLVLLYLPRISALLLKTWLCEMGTTKLFVVLLLNRYYTLTL